MVKSRGLPWQVRFGWNLATTLGVVVLAVAEYLDVKISPHKAEWLHSDRFQLGLAGLVLGVLFVDSARRTIRRFREHGEATRELEVHKILMSLLAGVADETPIKAADLGAGVYLPKHRLRRPRWFLKRVTRVRLIDSIVDSGIEFTSGKGAVGQCWLERREQHHDWRRINSAHASSPPNEEQWRRGVSTQSKFGFEHGEWRRLLGHHAEVAAWPITDDGEIIGVLAIDRAWHDDAADIGILFKSSKVRKALGLAAKLLAAELK